MRCVCGVELKLPDRYAYQACRQCGRIYKEVDDLGWFGYYTCEIYVPTGEFTAEIITEVEEDESNRDDH